MPSPNCAPATPPDTRSAGEPTHTTQYSLPPQSPRLPPHRTSLPNCPVPPAAFSQTIQLACFIKFHESPAALPHILCMLLIALHTHTERERGKGEQGRVFVVCLTGTCEYNSANLAALRCSPLSASPAAPWHSISPLCPLSRFPLRPFALAPILGLGISLHVSVVSVKATKTVCAFIYLLLISTVPGRNLFAINFITIIHVHTNK